MEEREVFVGLTVEESAEYFALTRSEAMDGGRQSPAERDRYLALNKVQAAKFDTVGTEIVVDRLKPTQTNGPVPRPIARTSARDRTFAR
ncbi:hypothetical protein ACRAWG_19375 [Methylobacterium sp. P31]